MNHDQYDDASDPYAFREGRSVAQDQGDLLQAAFGELEVIRVQSGGDYILCQRLAHLERLLEKLELLNRATLMSSRAGLARPGIHRAWP